jgi:hypothetical protein
MTSPDAASAVLLIGHREPSNRGANGDNSQLVMRRAVTADLENKSFNFLLIGFALWIYYSVPVSILDLLSVDNFLLLVIF